MATLDLGGPRQTMAAGLGNTSDTTIAIEETFPIPRARMWALWSTTEGLTRWLVKDARIELCPGGAYEVYFLTDAPPGARGSDDCVVLSYVAPRMLSFTWNAPPPMPDERAFRTFVVVELEDADGATRLRLTHAGWPAEGMEEGGAWRKVYEYFDAAWPRVFAELRAHVGGA